MGIKFILMVNKQGQTRLAQYYDQYLSLQERRVLESEIVRKCLARTEQQVSSPPPPIPISMLYYERPHDFQFLGPFFTCYYQCSFVEHRNYKIVYRRYASLFFLVGVDTDEVSHRFIVLQSSSKRTSTVPCLRLLQNELAILEFIHLLVETMDRYFDNVVGTPDEHTRIV